MNPRFDCSEWDQKILLLALKRMARSDDKRNTQARMLCDRLRVSDRFVLNPGEWNLCRDAVLLYIESAETIEAIDACGRLVNIFNDPFPTDGILRR